MNIVRLKWAFFAAGFCDISVLGWHDRGWRRPAHCSQASPAQGGANIMGKLKKFFIAIWKKTININTI